MATDQTFKYFAFISYNSADEKWAKWLQNKLEYYQISSALYKEYPSLPKRIRPVFWYKKDLSGTKLKQALFEELKASKFLIVVCSPDSAKSAWVDEEIQAFIRLGKGDKIIPFIVGGTPHAANPKVECFPPSLLNLSRDEEIRGIDVRRKEGKNHALVDVIATMFEVRFDDLWQRHKRRARSIFYMAAAVVFAVMIAGLLYYDYSRSRVEYYADYVDCWGVPKGVVKLNEEQKSHRSRSYRFTYQRVPIGQPNSLSWRLNEVAYVNSADVPQEHIYTENMDRYSIQNFRYGRTNGVLTRIDYCASSGRILLRHNISEHDGVVAAVADLASAAEGKGAAFIGVSTTAIEQGSTRKSNIKRLAYERNDEGYIVRQTFHSNNDDYLPNSCVADGDGIFGMQYTLDSLGRRVRIQYLGLDGQYCTNRRGVAGKSYEYNEHGTITRCTYLDVDGNPIPNELFWSEFRDMTDEYGNVIDSRYFNEDGYAAIHKLGMSRWMMNYDNRGNIVEQYFLDSLGNPCYHIDGYHREINEYDSQGRLVLSSTFDVNNIPCSHRQGHSVLALKYDSQGNLIEERVYGTDGAPIENPDYGAIFRTENDENGYCCYNAHYDAENRLYVVSLGYAVWKADLDEDGNIVEERFYGTDGELCLITDNYAVARFKRDSKGNVIEQSYYGVDEKPCMTSMGYATAKYKFDALGNIIFCEVFDAEGKPAYQVDGASKWMATYDNKSNRIMCRYFDCMGEPIVLPSGVSEWRAEYDQLGNMVKQSYYDLKGRPTLQNVGFSIAAFKFDSRGNCIGCELRDTHNQLCNIHKGYAIWESRFDERGNEIEFWVLDKNRKPCMHVDGFHRWVKEYDNVGNCIATRYYDTKGEEVTLEEA